MFHEISGISFGKIDSVADMNSIAQPLDNQAWPDLQRAVELRAGADFQHGDSDMGSPPDRAIPIDSEALLRRCMGNLEFATRVLRKFAGRFGADLAELEAHLQQGRSVEVARTAHRIKGASANAAALELHRIAQDIEGLATSNQLSEIPAHLDQIVEAWNQFVVAVSPCELESVTL